MTKLGPAPLGGHLVSTSANDIMTVDVTEKAMSRTTKAMDEFERYTT